LAARLDGPIECDITTRYGSYWISAMNNVSSVIFSAAVGGRKNRISLESASPMSGSDKLNAREKLTICLIIYGTCREKIHGQENG
jgi:hypothetical protein